MLGGGGRRRCRQSRLLLGSVFGIFAKRLSCEGRVLVLGVGKFSLGLGVQGTSMYVKIRIPNESCAVVELHGMISFDHTFLCFRDKGPYVIRNMSTFRVCFTA